MIEQTLINLLNVDGRVHVERSRLPEQLSIDASLIGDQSAFPVTVKVRHLRNRKPPPSHNGYEETRSHLQIKADEDAHAAEEQKTATTESLETIHAKYLIACDGAHSWTRRQLELPMEGDGIDIVWGVIDIIPLTNFRMCPTLENPAKHSDS